MPTPEENVHNIPMIAWCISVADEIEIALDQALACSERLRQSILKRAFERRLAG